MGLAALKCTTKHAAHTLNTADAILSWYHFSTPARLHPARPHAWLPCCAIHDTITPKINRLSMIRVYPAFAATPDKCHKHNALICCQSCASRDAGNKPRQGIQKQKQVSVERMRSADSAAPHRYQLSASQHITTGSC